MMRRNSTPVVDSDGAGSSVTGDCSGMARPFSVGTGAAEKPLSSWPDGL